MPSDRHADRRREKAARALRLSLAEYEKIERFSDRGDVEDELVHWPREGLDDEDREEAAAHIGQHFDTAPGLAELALTVPGQKARRLLGAAIFLVLVVPTAGRLADAAWLLWSLASFPIAFGLTRLLWSRGGARLRGALRLMTGSWVLLLPAMLAMAALAGGLLAGPLGAPIGLAVVLANALLLPLATGWDLRRRRRQLARQALRAARARQERLELRVEKRSQLLGPLRAHDPDFDERVFQERVARAFVAVHEALGREDLSSIEPFVSDAVFERFELELEERRRLGQRVELRRLFVQEVAISHMETRDHFDELTVGIQAKGELVRRERTASGDAPSQPLASLGAFWTLVRRSAAVTREGAGLLEGQCPSCGAPAAVNQSVRCEACRTLLKSAEHDWILTEITRPREWTPRAPSRVPGIERLREDDPAFGLHHLEDRASVILCRMLASERAGQTERLERMASPQFCAGLEALHARGGPAKEGGAVEISCVETLAIEERGDWFEARICVRWHAEAAPPGAALSTTRPDAHPIGSARLVLGRRRGVRSDPERSISSAHCAACGAPDTGRGGDACAFCGVRLNDGSRDWILLSVEERS